MHMRWVLLLPALLLSPPAAADANRTPAAAGDKAGATEGRPSPVVAVSDGKTPLAEAGDTAPLVAAAGKAPPPGALPPETGPPISLSGYLGTGYWSSNRRLDDKKNYTPLTLWLKMSANPGGGWYLRGEGWATDERPFERGTRVFSDVREGYVGWRNDTVEITAGRRIIAWGRADRVNPTDVVNSRNYTRLFSEDEQQKQGHTVVTVSRAFGNTTVTALWLPEFRANLYPIPPTYGLSFRQGADRFDADQMAFRVDHAGTNLDWSLTYFRGLNRNPAARLEQISSAGVALRSVYDRMQLVGADFATTFGGFGVRGETAYTQSAISSGAVFSPRSFVKSVIGADRDVLEGLNVNAQYVFQYVFSYVDPARESDFTLARIAIKTALLNNQRLRTQHGPAIRVGYTTLHDTLTLEVSALAFLSDSSYAVRPRATYAINDHVQLIGGADVFRGPRDSFFGQLQSNTLFFSEIHYSF